MMMCWMVQVVQRDTIMTRLKTTLTVMTMLRTPCFTASHLVHQDTVKTTSDSTGFVCLICYQCVYIKLHSANVVNCQIETRPWIQAEGLTK